MTYVQRMIGPRPLTERAYFPHTTTNSSPGPALQERTHYYHRKRENIQTTANAEPHNKQSIQRGRRARAPQGNVQNVQNVHRLCCSRTPLLPFPNLATTRVFINTPLPSSPGGLLRPGVPPNPHPPPPSPARRHHPLSAPLIESTTPREPHGPPKPREEAPRLPPAGVHHAQAPGGTGGARGAARLPKRRSLGLGGCKFSLHYSCCAHVRKLGYVSSRASGCT